MKNSTVTMAQTPHAERLQDSQDTNDVPFGPAQERRNVTEFRHAPECRYDFSTLFTKCPYDNRIDLLQKNSARPVGRAEKVPTDWLS